MKCLILLFCYLIFISSFAYANGADKIQQLIERNFLLQLIEESLYYQENGTIVQAISDTCLSAPLPTDPGVSNYSVTHEVLGEKFSMVFWREVCEDGTGVALLMKATPEVGSPFLCSAAFTMIQNGVQHNYINLQSEPGGNDNDSWCADLFVPITLIVNGYEFVQTQFDPARALTIIYNFVVEVRLDIPDYSPGALP